MSDADDVRGYVEATWFGPDEWGCPEDAVYDVSDTPEQIAERAEWMPAMMAMQSWPTEPDIPMS